MSSKPIFLVMRFNGMTDEVVAKPITAFNDERDADYFARRMNRSAAILEGKIDAREAIMQDWRETTPGYDREEETAHQDKLDKLLELDRHVAELGFENIFQIEHPKWSVTEVPLNMLTP